jgi:UDP-2,3-diacylglucosamine hydrolase
MDPKSIPTSVLSLPEQSVLFFSDVHLGAHGAVPQERIVELIDRHAAEVGAVFILGDLFDFWYGYRTVVFSHFLPLLFRLRRLTESGVAVHYIAGNHDFCLGPAFGEHLGVRTYDGAIDLRLGRRRVYLAHGDLINPEDRGYRLLHRLVRSRAMDLVIRLVPPDLGWRLAMAFSRRSRKHSAKKRWKRTEIFHRYARQVFDLGYDGVMMGHSHAPELTLLEHGARECFVANTGDWVRSYTTILYRPGKGFTLEHAGAVQPVAP